MLVNKKDFLSFSDRKKEEVEIAPFGCSFIMRSMSVRDQIAYEREVKEGKSEEASVFGLIKRVCIDEDGNRLFTDEDIEMLAEKSTSGIMELFKECLRVNTIDHREIEEMAKN